MRHWLESVAAIALIAAAAWVGWAQSASEPKPKAQTPPQARAAAPKPLAPKTFDFGRMMPLMAALDADRNGELSAEEIAGASEALKKLDKNQDGKLSRDELRPSLDRPEGPGGFPGGPPGMGPGGFPFGAGPFPGGPPGGPGGPAGPPPTGRSGRGVSAPLQTPVLPKDDFEKKLLDQLQQIQQKQGRRMNVPAQDGRLLRTLAEAIGAKTVVEIGTSNGVSALWICLALRKTGGKLITHEIDPQVAALARENFAAAGVADLVTVVEGDAHQTVSKLTGPIDLVFIDADKEGYLDYLNKTLPLLRPGGLVLAHNINARMADSAFVKAITTNPELETLLYQEGAGMSISLKKR